MSRRRLIAGSLALAALLLVCRGNGSLAGGPKKHQTPHEVFDAFKEAFAKKDAKLLCDTLTDESIDDLAGVSTAIMFLEVTALPQEKIDSATKKLFEVLAKHGITEEHLLRGDGKYVAQIWSTANLEKAKAAVRKALAPVKDRRAYLIDLLNAMIKLIPDEEKKAKKAEPILDLGDRFVIGENAVLHDVKAEKDRARAVAVSTVNGEKYRTPVNFRREGGSWRLHITLEAIFNYPQDDKIRERIYVATPQPIVEKMLEIAKVTSKDIVYDIGCGDGRTLITAVKKYDCTAKGFEMGNVKGVQVDGKWLDRDKEIHELAKDNIKREKLSDRATVELVKDLGQVDVSRATVVTVYMLPERIDQLEKQVEKLKPGVRFVFHDYCFNNHEPDRVIEVKGPERTHTLYLFTTPLKKKKNAQQLFRRMEEKLAKAAALELPK